MRKPQPNSDTQAEAKKPARPRGPVGLFLYGLLTILGGLALIVVAE
jgi:hypothetical protein